MNRRMTTKHTRSETGDPLLLTPGPLTTSASVKQAMVHDWGSRDANFLGINRMVLEKIAELAPCRYRARAPSPSRR
jgi:2-aminoethylphosphonate-pyruvate transaminase